MQKEVLDKIAAPLTAAFGLVAALAWNYALQEIFRFVSGQQSVLCSSSYNNSNNRNHAHRVGHRKDDRKKAGEGAE